MMLTMRIESQPGVAVSTAYVWLTSDEARHLRDVLNSMLEHGARDDWHAHVSSADYQTEVTIAGDTRGT